MRVVRTAADLAAALAKRAPGSTLGLVPTMGGLHAGHAALVAASVAACDVTAVSLFVNPAQFAAGEDLASYPRSEDADLALLASLRADVVFAPSPAEVYPPGYCTYVTTGVGAADTNPASEGAGRPDFFRGVATVVTKLLVLARPDAAYFGRKDAQQLAVVRRLAADLWLSPATRIVAVDTVRAPDGLALSSRNAYLTAPERAAAPVLHRALAAAAAAASAGERRADALRAVVADAVRGWEAASGARALRFQLLYVSVCAASDMREVHGDLPAGAEVLACIAANMGDARLIDNVVLQEAQEGA